MKVPDHIHISPKERRSLTIAVLISFLAGYFLIRNFISLIIVAVIVAFIFTPVYRWLLKKTGSTGRASALTLLLTILAIVIPLIIILLITVAQAKTIINDISSAVANQNMGATLQGWLDWLNNFLSNLTGRTILITQEQLQNQLAHYLSNIANYVINLVSGWVGSLGSIITNVILYMYVFTAVLVHQQKLRDTIKALNPLGEDVTDLYLERSGSMTKAMVKGQFIIAILQGTWSAAVLAMTGMPYFAFFALILSFLSIIPLGAGIVTIPIGIVRILMGDIWQGAVIVLNHLIIVTNIDNVLKPKLVPQAVRLQPALILLAVFGGMALFGFLGIIIGPVLMILIITTIDMYLRTTDKLVPEEPKQVRKSGLFTRLLRRA